ncbi:MAG TPA: ATP synthase F1 subunit epsilon [Candidatus Kapabacteria bacterium]|nr:ATP synthase F1 subunit epsilon [Candidatus Kapabacteria bacterium]
MSRNITLKIVTPTQTVFEGDVDQFTAPGDLGAFQVLHNHAPIVSKLVPGLLKFQQTGGTEVHYYVSGGFLELHDDIGIVLADSAEHSDKINVAQTEAAITELRRRYADHEIHNDEFHRELDVLNAKLSVAKAP